MHTWDLVSEAMLDLGLSGRKSQCVFMYAFDEEGASNV